MKTTLGPIAVSNFNSQVYHNDTAFVQLGSDVELLMNQDNLSSAFLIFKNAGESTNITIKAGTGPFACNDRNFAIGKEQTTVIALEVGAFKNLSGENKGKILITGGSNTISVMAYLLPWK